MNGKLFSGLMPAEIERLSILSEECAEVVKAVSKIVRHGWESRNPDDPNSPTNREHLENELGDVRFATLQCVEAGDVDSASISNGAAFKRRKIVPFLHHQPKPTPSSDGGDK